MRSLVAWYLWTATSSCEPEAPSRDVQATSRASDPAASASSEDDHAGWLEEAQRRIEHGEYQPRATEGGLGFRNRSQGLHGQVDNFGELRLTSRDAGTVLSSTPQPVDVALRTTGWGRPGWEAAAPPAVVSVGDCTTSGELDEKGECLRQIAVERGLLTEWWSNTPGGVEVGWIIPAAPPGSGPLVVDLHVRGATVNVDEDGQVAHLGAQLRCDGVRAWDTTGRALLATLERHDGGLRVAVADANAVYPVTIDPLLTTEAWRGEGPQALANYAFSAEAAGDVNGDGYGDVIVGAPFYDNGQNDEGRVFVYHGGPAGLPATASWTEEIDQADAYFGWSVATAGDVNGDGYSDVVIGAPSYTNGQTNEGAVFVYHGSATGLSLAITLESGLASSDFGYSVASAGAVKGDTYSAIIVGAPGYSNGHTGEGKIFVYLGSSTGITTTTWGTGYESNLTGAGLGHAVASAGDVNGDGRGDVIAGVINYANAQTNEGRAVVFYGATTMPTSPSWAVEADLADAHMGVSVACAGDVNGDGYSDVIVGAGSYTNGQTEEGRAYVYHGGSGGLAATANWTAESNDSFSEFGFDVSSAGDINGDGFGDVIIGSRYDDNTITRSGQASVYLGSPAGVTTSHARFYGEATDEEFGHSVASAGDVNGDGFGDVIIGAKLAEVDGRQWAGNARLYYGSGSAPESGFFAWSANGATSDRFGDAASGVGDVNGDGFSDFMFGIPENSSAAGGSAFLYFGRKDWPPTTSSWSHLPTEVGAEFGSWISPAGDINGDGFADFLVGAPGYSAGEAAEGAIYVFHGGAVLPAAPSRILSSNKVDGGMGLPGTAAAAGDINGDGYGDVVVSAPGGVGEVWVYYGSSAGLQTNAGWTAHAGGLNDRYGAWVSAAGDVDGDGFGDVIIGCPGCGDRDQAGEGWAYVYLGGPTGLDDQPTWTNQGNQIGAQYGASVGGAVDVNSDGFDDIVVGAPGYDTRTSVDGGSTYVYYGSPRSSLFSDVWTKEGLGAVPDRRQGTLAGSIGDTNGDGFGDIYITAPGYRLLGPGDPPGLGLVLVYGGSDSGLSATGTDMYDEYSVTLPGKTNIGKSSASAGDVNGDGFTDFILSADSTTGSSTVYLYLGNAEDRRGPHPSPVRIRAQRPGADTVITPGLTSDSNTSFNVRIDSARPSWGRTGIKLQVEAKPLGQPFDGAGSVDSGSWSSGASTGVSRTTTVSGLSPGSYHWRARVRYDPSDGLPLLWSPWQYGSAGDVLGNHVIVGPKRPFALADTAIVNEGGSVDIAVLANDTTPAGAPAYTSVTLSGLSHGTASVVGSAVRFVHDGTEPAGPLAAFRYTFTHNGVVSNEATVTLSVTPTNDGPIAVADSGSVTEGGSTWIQVLSNDSDPDGEPLSYGSVLISNVGRGTAVVEGQGVRFQHDGNEGTSGAGFSYAVRDGSGTLSNLVSVSISVQALNDPPTARDDATSVPEGGSVLIPVLTNDSDPEGTALAYGNVVAAAPSHGTVTPTLNGISYVHNGSETTTDSFTYAVSDGDGGAATATVRVVIEPVNDAPVANPDNATVPEGGEVVISVVANDSDVDSGPPSNTRVVIDTAPVNGLATPGSAGVTYRHSGSETRSDSFTYRVLDAQGLSSAPATVSLSITPFNDPPVAAPDTATVREGETVVIRAFDNDTDEEGTVSGAFTSSAAVHGTVRAVSGAIEFTHDGSSDPNASFRYALRDAANPNLLSNEVDVTITVTPINDAPNAAPDAATVAEGGSVLIPVLDNDSDEEDGDLSDYDLVEPGIPPERGAIEIEPDGILYSHDGSEPAPVTFSYLVHDSDGSVSSGTVTIGVTPANDPPVAVDDSAFVREGDEVFVVVLANDYDPDGEPLDDDTIVIVSTQNGTAEALPGGVLFTHDGSQTTAGSFTYQVYDAAGAPSNVAVVVLTVGEVDNRPGATPDFFTVVEGETVLATVLSNDTDPDGDPLSYGDVEILETSSGEATVDATAGVWFTHDGSEGGTASFVYTVTDLTGEVSEPTLVTLSVEPRNDAPVAFDDRGSVDEGGTVVLYVLDNDMDVDDAELRYVPDVEVLSTTNGSAVVLEDGVQLTHDGSETLTAGFTYRVRDAAGAWSGQATATVDIRPVNDPPLGEPDRFTVTEGGEVLLTVLDNDRDPEGEALSYQRVVVVVQSHGSAEVSPGGIRFRHDGSEPSEAGITYFVTDQAGAASEVIVAFVEVLPENDAPVAMDDRATVPEGGSVLVPALDNDVDPDSLLSYTQVMVTGSTHGTAVVEGDAVRYSHDGSEGGTGELSYYLVDAAGAASNTATVVVDISPSNDPPQAIDDHAEVEEGGAVEVAVLRNDLDPEGVPLSYGDIEILQVQHGAVDILGGSVLYTHDGSETSRGGWTYRVTDGTRGISGVATVTVDVLLRNDVPVAIDDRVTADEGGEVLIDVLANDLDEEDELADLGRVLVVAASNGEALVEQRSIRFTHNGAEGSTASIQYIVQDSGGEYSNVADVEIVIRPINDPPIVRSDDATVQEGGEVLIPILLNDEDPEGESLLYARVMTDGAVNGAVRSDPQGVVFEHDGSEGTSASFRYVVEDLGGARSEPATVVLTVLPTNDPPIAVADQGLVDAGGVAHVDVLTNDRDPDGEELIYPRVRVSGALHGQARVDKAGISFQHDGSSEPGSFLYDVEDSEGARSKPATVTLAIRPPNLPPVAAADEGGSVPEGGEVFVDVLLNDNDPEGEALAYHNVSVVGEDAGVAQVEGGGIRFVHDGSEGGQASFTYVVRDSFGAPSAPQEVLIVVEPINDPPVVVDDAAVVDEGATVDVPVLANDFDPEQEPLSYANVLVVSETGGSAALAPGGIRFTQDGSEATSASFTYQVLDSQGAQSAVATVLLTVELTNDPPTAAQDVLTVTEGGAGVIDVLANDADEEDLVLDYTNVQISSSEHGSATVEGAAVRFVHDGTEGSAASFDYLVRDSDGSASQPTRVMIEVLPENDPPSPTPDSVEVDYGDCVSIRVLDNDSDPDSSTLNLARVDASTPWATLTAQSNEVEYCSERVEVGAPLPELDEAEESFPDAFRYTVSDGLIGVEADVTVRVRLLDGDEDGLDDMEEDSLGTDPGVADSDGDGLFDGDEVAIGSDPNDRLDGDADGDGSPTQQDCNDENDQIYPGNLTDLPGDGIDQDCSKTDDCTCETGVRGSSWLLLGLLAVVWPRRTMRRPGA
jgi:hypothetical protein